MKKEELAFFRGISAGIAFTYLCTGHIILAGVSLISWGAMEAGIKKPHKNIPYVDPNQPVQAEA